MKNLSVSVIVPTYNRKEILQKCLTALFFQSCPKSDYEIIVINDGSTDSSEELVGRLINESPCVFKYFKQRNRGYAAAKNVGFQHANGEIVLFMKDDIIATPNLLEQHILWHEEYPDVHVAILGYLTWSPEIKITQFMKWLESGGQHFCFRQIKDSRKINTQDYFYTANISLKRKVFSENNEFFKEEFSFPVFDDMELRNRLKNTGLLLKFNKDAIGYHYHRENLRNYCRRAYKMGLSLALYHKKIHDMPLLEKLKKIAKLDSFLFRIKFIFLNILQPIFELLRMKSLLSKSYNLILQGSFLAGVEKGLKNRINRK